MRERRGKGPKLPPGLSFAPDGSLREAVPSARPAQVASVLQRALQERITRGLADPRLQGMVSVQEVSVSPDLLHARVSVSVLPSDRGPLSIAALRSAAGFLRSSLRDATTLRRVPELVFELRSSLPTIGLPTMRLGATEVEGDAVETDHAQTNMNGGTEP